MDLTTTYPRSVKEKFAGVVMLGRAIDKGRARNAGTIGEYKFDCPMDQAVFGLLGINAESFAKELGRSDADLEKYCKENFVSKVDSAKLEEFNTAFLTRGPSDPDGQVYFEDLRNQIAPDRKDVTAWADLLDLDEKRPVPIKTPA